MEKHKSNARTFKGMKYRKVQRKNSRNRDLLTKENRQWLKNNSYKNIGWNNVIALYQKIVELQREEQINDLDLESLFLEADRIGNKYFTDKEIYEKQQALAKEVNEIAEIIDRQFSDNEIEIVDYSKNNRQLLKNSKKIKSR